MKKKFFMAIAGFSAIIQSLTAGLCGNSCGQGCFGFDSVLTFDVGGGYRNDSLKWRQHPDLLPEQSIQERWKNVGLGVVEANAQFLACEHYLFKADFDFGWFTNSGSQRITGITAPGIPINYKSTPKGNVCDLSGGIGYQFNFDCYRISLAPLVGYSYHQQRYKNHTYRNELEPLADPFSAHNNYKFRWSGPWIGFALAYQATCELQLYFDYSYHWARFRGTVKENFY